MKNLVWGFPNAAYKVSMPVSIPESRVAFGGVGDILTSSPSLIYDATTVSFGIGGAPLGAFSVSKNSIINFVTYNRNNDTNLAFNDAIYQHDIQGYRNGGAGNQVIARVTVSYVGDGTTRLGRYTIGTAEGNAFGNSQLNIFTRGTNSKCVAIGGGQAGNLNLSLTPALTTANSAAASVMFVPDNNSPAAVAWSNSAAVWHSAIFNATMNWGINSLVDDGFKFDVGGTMRVKSGFIVAASTTTINASAALQVDSTTQGLLLPRMTTAQRTAIATPAAGLMVYDTSTNKSYTYNGSTWNEHY